VAGQVGLLSKPGGGPAWYRHPLAFLVEAADDICYHVIDIEDGFKTGVVSFGELEALHRPFLEPRHLERAARFPDDSRRAGYFRAVTIDRVIRQVVEVFARRYEAIMTGAHDRPLLEEIGQAGDFAAFTALARRRIYDARPVVEVNVCGFEVLAGLLDAFLEAVEDRAAHGDALGARSRTLLHLLPQPHPDPAELAPYARVQLVTDFVAGMTDSYAVELYQRIRGIALP
jgi:dGTPase